MKTKNNLVDSSKLKCVDPEKLNFVHGGSAQSDSQGPWVEVPSTDPAKKNKKIIPSLD